MASRPALRGITDLTPSAPTEVLSRPARRPGPLRRGEAAPTARHRQLTLMGTSRCRRCASEVSWCRRLRDGARSSAEPTAGLDRAAHATTVDHSVCTGSMLLAARGILKGSSHHGTGMSLTACPPTVRVRAPARGEQGKVITGAGVSLGHRHGAHAGAHIAGDDAAQAIQLSIEYDPQRRSGRLPRRPAIVEACAPDAGADGARRGGGLGRA